MAAHTCWAGVVNFLHGSWYGAAFWILNTIDKNTNVLVVAEQCLDRAKHFSASRAALTVRRLGVYKRLGRDSQDS